MSTKPFRTAPLPLTTLLLVSCGTVGGILFTATYLIEGRLGKRL